MKHTVKVISFFLILVLFIYFSGYAGVASDVNELLSSQGKVLFGQEPNSIFVIDYPENIKRIDDYLAMVDTPPQQVLIEARVVEVKLESENALGINWTAFSDSPFLIGEYTIGGSSSTSPIEQNIDYKSTVYPPLSTSGTQEAPFTLTIFDENINVVLRALANSYNTNILSAPRITTVNNREAEIKIIQKLPWAEPVVEMVETSIAITWNINFEEVGIILRVTPTITEDGQISMELQPEVSEKVSDYSLSVVQGTTEIPYTVPVIDRRTADTKVVVGNSQTLIIGGLIKEKLIEGETKVPFLGDIPGLGWLFKSKKDTKEKSELLIFVSPTIITQKVVKEMQSSEELDIGKWYMDERKKKRNELLEKMENKESGSIVSVSNEEVRKQDLLDNKKTQAKLKNDKEILQKYEDEILKLNLRAEEAKKAYDTHIVELKREIDKENSARKATEKNIKESEEKSRFAKEAYEARVKDLERKISQEIQTREESENLLSEIKKSILQGQAAAPVEDADNMERSEEVIDQKKNK
ncbi:MAG: hypothetical protein ABH872_02645 [Candidatus Omnitrophota bacterium]